MSRAAPVRMLPRRSHVRQAAEERQCVASNVANGRNGGRLPKSRSNGSRLPLPWGEGWGEGVRSIEGAQPLTRIASQSDLSRRERVSKTASCGTPGYQGPYRFRTKPTMSLVAFMVSAAIVRARSAPSIRIASTWPGSATSRFISEAIGDNLATQSSTSAFLKLENCPPPNSRSTSALVLSASAA